MFSICWTLFYILRILYILYNLYFVYFACVSERLPDKPSERLSETLSEIFPLHLPDRNDFPKRAHQSGRHDERHDGRHDERHSYMSIYI